ncbi:LiaF transmembrane domain-containing protein [Anaerosacchariphilus polymeriproducens]|uniref:LiaF transmembrane domain-containing protein n=1 Tax=Anaerosacchariphilus polymeriproducens TaxID=1812858 RepID=A0A371AR09_9FIRM|nr:LiaF domain-containing protein [Anaerosacchariphilus polymeriproducens]RDU21974.1 hypothetical protein DWV06_15675 [Anaerosacchariphilus polymeriproducens]
MKKKDIFWGLLLIIAAVLIIVNKLGFYTNISMFEVVATIILLGILIKSIIHISFPGILFPAAFLCIIYADEWNITQLTPWSVLLTALLGSIGLSMIFKKHRFYKHHCNFHKENFSEVINHPDESEVNCSVSFSSSMKYINTDRFERANIKSSFGAMKVYFDNAVIQSQNAEIYLDVSFSGVELYIPKTWKVVNEVSASFGAVSEKNSKIVSDFPVVTIKGKVSFGGVEIIYI